MKTTLTQIAIGLTRLLTAVIFAMYVCGWLFNALDWLRSFSMPAGASALAKAPLIQHHPLHPRLLFVAQMLALYNAIFPGYGRFGSGLGMIIAALWAYQCCGKYTPAARLVIAVVAGFITGARLIMMISSDAMLVIYAGALGITLFLVHVARSSRPSRFQPLPPLPLGHQLVK